MKITDPAWRVRRSWASIAPSASDAISRGYCLAYDDFVSGNVCHFEIMNARRECIKKQRYLYGEDYARHIAQATFDRYLYGAAMDG